MAHSGVNIFPFPMAFLYKAIASLLQTLQDLTFTDTVLSVELFYDFFKPYNLREVHFTMAQYALDDPGAQEIRGGSPERLAGVAIRP